MKIIAQLCQDVKDQASEMWETREGRLTLAFIVLVGVPSVFLLLISVVMVAKEILS